MKLSANAETSDASELANVILNDYALTNKLLKLVNSAFYGLAAGKVTTITRAVVVLGYEHIRLATLSLALFEHFQTKSNMVDLKEAVIGSFWSGVLARDLAQTDNTVDPEEAFVCAMLSQLGKLVIIYYLPDEYRKISDCMNTYGQNETKAVKAACGVTYEEVGVAVAKQWNFPEVICQSLQVLACDDLQNKQKTPPKLSVLSNFVKEVSHLIQTGGLNGDEHQLAKLIDTYQPQVKISKRQLKTLIKDSADKVQVHAQALNLSLGNSTFIKNLGSVFQSVSGNSAVMPAAPSSESFQLTDGANLKTSNEEQGGIHPKDIIMEGIQEISQVMMADYDVNEVALMSLEILYRSLGFHRALMFVREGTGRKMTVRFGYGRDSRALTGRAGFKVTPGQDLFNLSIQVGKDLIVADAYGASIGHLIPAWYRRQIDAPAFIFLPVTVQKVCIGAFYADRDLIGQPIQNDEHRNLSMLRNQLVLAIKYRQGSR